MVKYLRFFSEILRVLIKISLPIQASTRVCRLGDNESFTGKYRYMFTHKSKPEIQVKSNEKTI